MYRQKSTSQGSGAKWAFNYRPEGDLAGQIRLDAMSPSRRLTVKVTSGHLSLAFTPRMKKSQFPDRLLSGQVCRLSRPFPQNPFSPNSNDVSFELLRRSEQPTAVVHETVGEQVHW
jgi:hypothetical protein